MDDSTAPLDANLDAFIYKIKYNRLLKQYNQLMELFIKMIDSRDAQLLIVNISFISNL